MNKIIKQIIKIADEEKIEIVSLSPIYKEMKAMTLFLNLFRESFHNQNLEIDVVYLVFNKEGNNILVPVFKNKIMKELIIKVNPDQVSYMLEVCDNLEESEEIEDTQLYN